MPVQVAPGAWMVQGESALGSAANRNFISNAGFVVTDDGVLVVDALGSPALAEELLAAIRRITDKPVRHIVVTHYHADHIYGLQSFKAAGAQVLAEAEGQVYLHSDTAALRLKASREELFPWIDEKTQLVAADRWIREPLTLRMGGLEFVVQPVGPAHTPEDLVVYVPQLKLLFAGDLVFRGRVPFVGQADSGRWIAGLDRLLAFDAQVIVPGHGPVSNTAREDLQMTRDYLAYLRKTMGAAARDMEPFEEAYKRTDWSRFETLPLFGAANRINAYNTYLLMEREGSQ
ncbi:MBL fold metallo-hydrolase [Paucibacter sp. JuS9]|uniref:MBL fold metallo-hydrolase n=1 Tax=Paucibacter sp. JuS9 TaxID=3228748 RepID=UPI0037580CED